jgi:hypothetical protein
VVTAAAAKSPPIIVEVTMFDAWQGTFATSPWNPVNNTQNSGFTQRKFFAAYDNGSSDSSLQNQFGRGRQIALMQKVADELNGFDNVYYEIANEPDIDQVANGVTGADVATWHAAMTTALSNHENTKPKRHLIAANFFTDAAFATVRSPTNGNRLASVVSGHYIDAKDLDTDGNGSLDLPRYGALSMIQRYHNGDGNELNRIFGFNETKAVCCVGSPSTPTGARAEAWEFMLNEGGMLDHYSLDRTTADASSVRDYLRALRGFLASFDLRNVQRVTAGTPASPPWMGYLGSQNLCNITSQGTTCFNWASLAWPGQQYGLYFHHGLASANTFAHYNVPAPTSHTLMLSLNNLASGCSAAAPCTFRYDWIEPATGAVKCATAACTGTISWTGSGSIGIGSPSYTFDIALRLVRQ